IYYIFVFLDLTDYVCSGKPQVLLFVMVLYFPSVVGQVISYSIPEEMAKGSFIGNVAHDLGLDVKRLQSGKARIHTGDRADYVQLDKEKGVLVIKEKIDREAICGQTTPCALHFQIFPRQPMEWCLNTKIIQTLVYVPTQADRTLKPSRFSTMESDVFPFNLLFLPLAFLRRL
uniref:Cadherin N-terminal domain-containing protein n=1 Tax=Hippocampus comes TaxID=109280 RepID=A0A3Q2XV70_HIPCM